LQLDIFYICSIASQAAATRDDRSLRPHTSLASLRLINQTRYVLTKGQALRPPFVLFTTVKRQNHDAIDNRSVRTYGKCVYELTSIAEDRNIRSSVTGEKSRIADQITLLCGLLWPNTEEHV
jgi:hypothetical protein